MDRPIVYPGAIPLDTDLLSTNRNAMLALGFLVQFVAGTGTIVDGLAMTPTSPASMVVNVGPGSIVSQATVDATSYGSLAADTTDALVKMGINLTSTAFTLTAPSTSGQSINYLVEAEFTEADGTAVVLPYYNSSNPADPYSGPSNSGTPQNTLRTQRVGLQLKAGTPATTGTQTTPAVDTGWVGLYVITVNYGATTVTSSAINVAPGAPFIPVKLSPGSLRVKLAANASLHVNASSGSDTSGNGSLFYPYATIQKAVNVVTNGYDLNGYSVTISCVGAFTAGAICSVPFVGGGSVIFDGGGTATVAATSACCFSTYTGATIVVQNFGALTATGSSSGQGCALQSNGGSIQYQAVTFGACTQSHIFAYEGSVGAAGNYTITGGAGTHVNASANGTVVISNVTITVSGTPAFSSGFVGGTQSGTINAVGVTFSGSATGPRFSLNLNATLYTAGAQASLTTNYLPGNAPGITSTGGQYA